MVDTAKYSFMAFCGNDNNCPKGGMHDALKDCDGVVFVFESTEDAKDEILKYALDNNIDWWHILNLSTGRMAACSR